MKTTILIVALLTILQFLGIKVLLETLGGSVLLYLSYKLVISLTQDILKSCGGRIW